MKYELADPKDLTATSVVVIKETQDTVVGKTTLVELEAKLATYIARGKEIDEIIVQLEAEIVEVKKLGVK